MPTIETGSRPFSCTTSGSTAATIPARSASAASAVIATIVGRSAAAVAVRIVRARSAASSSDSARGVPGTRLSPRASAPAEIAAIALPASPTPQIFTIGRRATLAGSVGAAPAATKARTVAAGSPLRTRASPTSPPSNPCARQRAIVSAERTPDSAMTSRSSGTSSRSRPARSGSTVSVRRSRLLMPIRRASVSIAIRSSRSSCASTSGSSPSDSARSTRSRRRPLPGCRTASSSTASAPARRSVSSCRGSTTNSLASTGIETAARTARRSSTDPPNQCGSHRTEMAAAPPAW